jgi:hypothetical protein
MSESMNTQKSVYKMDIVGDFPPPEDMPKLSPKAESQYDCYKQCWKSFSLTDSRSMYRCFQECNRKQPVVSPGVPVVPQPNPPPYILQNGKRWFSPEPLSKDK